MAAARPTALRCRVVHSNPTNGTRCQDLAVSVALKCYRMRRLAVGNLQDRRALFPYIQTPIMVPILDQRSALNLRKFQSSLVHDDSSFIPKLLHGPSCQLLSSKATKGHSQNVPARFVPTRVRKPAGRAKRHDHGAPRPSTSSSSRPATLSASLPCCATCGHSDGSMATPQRWRSTGMLLALLALVCGPARGTLSAFMALMAQPVAEFSESRVMPLPAGRPP